MSEANTQTHKYDPEWVAFAENVKMPGLPADFHEARQAFSHMTTAMKPMLPPTHSGITTRDEQINDKVKVRIYHPPSATKDNPLPCLVFCHGGGWIAGDLESEDHICRTVCGEVNCIVVSVDYQLHPEVVFPQPIEDCMAAYQWAYDNASTLGADANKYVIWGGSAGVTLAIAVTYKLISSGQRSRVHGLISMAGMSLYPDACPPEYKHLHKASVENGGPIPIVSWPDCELVFEGVGGKPPYSDPTWFPQSMGSQAFKDFPPTYIFNTSLECLRDDGTVLEAELKDAGCAVKRDVMDGFPHYFWSLPIEKGGRVFRQKLVDGIKWVLEAGSDMQSKI